MSAAWVKSVFVAVIFTLSCAVSARAECPGDLFSFDSLGILQQGLNLVPGRFSQEQYDRYLSDTLQGLEKIRGPNGLLADAAVIVPASAAGPAHLRILQEKTTPTNFALDLLVQTAVADRPGALGLQAKRNLQTVMDTLERLQLGGQYHKESGLFFNWYSSRGDRALGKDVSSVDNIHLALALYTLSRKFPDESYGKKAKAIFDKMDFSDFFHAETGMIGGNLKHSKAGWALEPWDYGEFGSESRDLYSQGYALGLFKKIPNQEDFIAKAVDRMHAELWSSEHGKILRTWDGGGFQLMLPELLSRESAYSTTLAESANGYGYLILADQKKEGIDFPAAFSASQFGIENSKTRFQGVPVYNGRAGNIELVSSMDSDVSDPKDGRNWERAFTPHPAMMAAMVNPDLLSSSFTNAETYVSGKDHFYNTGIGFSDGVHVKGEYKGQVVPVSLSLDQSMIALSILRMEDASGYGVSAGALASDPAVRARLEFYYGLVDRKLSQAAVFGP